MHKAMHEAMHIICQIPKYKYSDQVLPEGHGHLCIKSEFLLAYGQNTCSYMLSCGAHAGRKKVGAQLTSFTSHYFSITYLAKTKKNSLNILQKQLIINSLSLLIPIANNIYWYTVDLNPNKKGKHAKNKILKKCSKTSNII